MLNDWIASCLAYISDDLIEEAMFSKGKAKLYNPKRLLGIAACVCIFLSLAVVALIMRQHNQPSTDIEPFTSMTLEEVEGSIYARYIPDLTAYGYSLDSAGVYHQKVFKASYFSGSSEVTIGIESYSPEIHDAHIVDVESPNTSLDNKDPIFREDQFGIGCMEYVTVQTTATNRIITQFSVMSEGYVIRYVIKAVSQSEITQAIEYICLCYK